MKICSDNLSVFHPVFEIHWYEKHNTGMITIFFFTVVLKFMCVWCPSCFMHLLTLLSKITLFPMNVWMICNYLHAVCVVFSVILLGNLIPRIIKVYKFIYATWKRLILLVTTTYFVAIYKRKPGHIPSGCRE